MVQAGKGGGLKFQLGQFYKRGSATIGGYKGNNIPG
jgi:hypothetical protein